MKITSFKQWQEEKIRNTSNKKKVSCPDCFGYGLIACECECCGGEKDKKCETCCGTGSVVFGKLDHRRKKQCFSQANYENEVKKDLVSLADWTGKDFCQICVDFGFSVSTRLPDKEEICRIAV